MSSRAVFILLIFAATTPAQQLFEAVEPHMGTLMQIKVYTSDATAADKAFHAAFARIAAVDAALTDYQPDSELNRVCGVAVNREQHVSDDLFAVLAKAQKFAEETDGAFDVTIGSVTHLWREARKANRIPDAASIEEARSRSGYRKLHLDEAAHTVRLDQSGMQLDLGGIAKGYAADQALLVLHNAGVRSALVAASGDLGFSDAPPGEHGWKIGVNGADTLVLENAAVSTSGDAEQHFDLGGHRYSHIIDTQTGIGLTNRMTVTVVAAHGIDADGADTAVDVLGAEAGMKFIERHPELSAVLLLRNENPPRVLLSKRFQRLTTFAGVAH